MCSIQEITTELGLLYKKTFESYFDIKYEYKNEGERLYLLFMDSIFIRTNNLVSSCNHLTSIGYADETMVLTRSLMEVIVDFIKVMASEKEKNEADILNERIERVETYYKHQYLYPAYCFSTDENLKCELKFSDEQKIKREEYIKIFGKNPKWYKTSLTSAIGQIFKADPMALGIYKQTSFYVHNNYMFFDRTNERYKYSDCPLHEACHCYQTIYNYYLKMLSKCAPEKKLFTNRYEEILDSYLIK